MRDKNPIEPLLNQVGDLLHKIQTYDKPLDTIPPEILKELEVLEKSFRRFQDLNQQALDQAQIDIGALKQKTISPNSQIATQDKQVIEKSIIMERDAEQMRRYLIQVLKNRQSQEPAKDKSIKERRKKYKPLGGDKGWIRL